MHSLRPSPKPVGKPLAKSARVLILDDERFDRHRLQRLSSGLPVAMDVVTADSLAALTELLESTQFDLIFVDLNLPDGSGLDALELIRLCPRNCTAATVMVSGYVRTEVAEKAREGGCSHFLSKDDLSPTSFAQAVALALYTSEDPVEGSRQTFDRQQVEEIIQTAGRDFARNMKPMVSRMLRQMRNLRDGSTSTQPSGFQSVENSCVQLWDYLLELERKQHRVDAHKNLPDKDRAAPPTRKPPSPFSRIN